MSTRRKHRGPHPEDHRLFGEDQWPKLREATADLAWLWSRGYAQKSSIALVGDRFQLTARQRIAVGRSCCTDLQRERRQRKQHLAPIAGEAVVIDGFNLITTLEAAFSGGVLLLGRDGCLRDMASMHGGYHLIGETLPAIGLLLHYLKKEEPDRVEILLDQPVSNSGRLAQTLRLTVHGLGLDPDRWQAKVVGDPDAILGESENLVVTADSVVLDHASRWNNLALDLVRWAETQGSFPERPWLVDMAS